MNRFLLFLLLAALLTACVFPAYGEEIPYRTLQKGDSGEDVLRLKEAMYMLGYFSTRKFSSEYNDTTAERVKQLQKKNGLSPTGKADPELQALIYSGECVDANGRKPGSTAGLGEDGLPLDLPEKTEAGFLPEGHEPYLYQNEDQGLWMYLTQDLAIEIRRYEDKDAKNIWFECDVRASEASPLRTAVNWRTPGKTVNGINPVKLAEAEQAVLAISDDHFGTRLSNKKTVGIEIRGGQIISDKTYKADRSAFPNLEALAVFADGKMKTYLSNAHTAQEYLDMGAADVFSFGPILVQDGQPGPHMADKDYYHYREPRCALGMIEPYHYFILVTNGREQETARGVYLNWLAEKMLEKGVTEAINLDGGGTTALVFMGKRLNRTGSSVRNLYSCICFGTLPQNEP